MIKIFFHVYAGNDMIFEIINDMITRIHFSQLYNTCDIIYVFISGNKNLIFQISYIIKNAGKKFKIVCESPDDKSYERLTLENIHKYIDENDKCLYIMTKGISSWANRNPIFKKCLYEWVYFMTYFLISKHMECIEKLNNYDTVGTVYRTEPKPHWSGNMWWATGKHILNLPKKIGINYYDTELNFIFLNNPSFYEMSKEKPSYSVYIPKTIYID